MVVIKNVAIVGAAGSLGKPVLNVLISANKFNVSVITRPTSTSTYPSSVKVIKADFDSLSSLTEALTGQDALVSTVGTAGFVGQALFIDAAIAAGVKRILPSEFGSNIDNPKTAALPVFGHKVATRKHLEEKVKNGADITYTYVINGPFLDWGLSHGFLLAWQDGKPSLYDGGERYFSVTTLASVGTAVVGVLSNYEETKNRSVFVQDLVISQKRLLELAQKVKPEKKLEPTTVLLTEVEKSAKEGLARGDYSFQVLGSFLFLAIFGEGYGSLFEKTDNELLGLSGKSEADVEEIWKGLLN